MAVNRLSDRGMPSPQRPDSLTTHTQVKLIACLSFADQIGP